MSKVTKQKIKNWFLKWSGAFAFSMCLGLCIGNAIHGDWEMCLMMLPFCFLWFMFWAQGRICDRLAERNGHLVRKDKALFKIAVKYATKADIEQDKVQYFLHKYMNAQNDADFCKRKINCTDYLSHKRYYEFMIERFELKLKGKGVEI